MSLPPRSPAPRSSFVTVMAWLSLGVAAMSALASLMQALLALAMPDGGDLGGLLPPGTTLPPLLDWLARHAVSLSLLSAVLSLGVAGVSWALLQRREWGRQAFIGVLALVALANFAGIPLVDATFDMAVASLARNGGDAAAQLRDAGAPMLSALRLVCWIGALAIAAVHAWIIWQLCRPAIRAEFQR